MILRRLIVVALLLLACSWVPAPVYARRALTVVNSVSSGVLQPFSGSATWNFDFSGTFTASAGNLLVGHVCLISQSRTFTSMAADGSDTATSAIASEDFSSTHRQSMRYVVPATTTTIWQTVLNNTSSLEAWVTVREISGQHASPFDVAQSIGETTGGTSHGGTNLTTAEDNEILVGGTCGSNGAYTLDATFANSLSVNYGVAGTKAAAVAGSHTMTNTSAAGENSETILAAFKQAGAVTAVPKLLLLGVGGTR